MMPTVKLEEQRRQLLQVVIDYTETGHLNKGFIKEFMNYVRELDFELVKTGQDFFALFTQDMNREVDFNLAWPLATVNRKKGFTLYYNPISFLFLKKEEALALLKHEVMHLILKHPARKRSLKKRYSNLAINLAMDIAVNQYIANLPAFSEKLSSVNARFDLEMEDNLSLEAYTRTIQAAIEKFPKAKEKLKKDHGIDFNRVHEIWESGENPNSDAVKEDLRGRMDKAKKAGLPKELKTLGKLLEKPKIAWTCALKSAITTLPQGKKKTVTRRNRRQPHRTDLRGELRDRLPEVIVAIDISASIQTKDLTSYVTEVLGITRSYGKALRIIECDDTIRRDYEIQCPGDLKAPLERTGGTAFSPVFELLQKEGKTMSLLVYFTDGAGEKNLSLRPRHQTIWVVTGPELSLEKPYGQVHLIANQNASDDRIFSLDAMRELLNEWAR